MKKEKVIPIKNYIKLALIFIITLICVFYANSWYKTYKVDRLNTPYIKDKISAINYEELDTYLTENQNLIIYIGKNNDQGCYDFEKNLYNVIKKNDLVEETIFLDLSNNYSNEILKEIEDKYYADNLNIDITSVPALLIIQNRQVKDVLISDDAEGEITSDKIVQFLVEFEYIK